MSPVDSVCLLKKAFYCYTNLTNLIMFETITIYPIFGWFIIFLTTALYAIISIVLFYHWRAYAKNEKMALLFESIYFLVSFAIIALAFLFLLVYKVNP